MQPANGRPDGRPAEASNHRSTQALVYLSTETAWLDRHRAADPGRPRLLDRPAEVAEQVAQYHDAGVDEFIVPDWTMGRASRAIETLDLFRTEVAAHLS